MKAEEGWKELVMIPQHLKSGKKQRF